MVEAGGAEHPGLLKTRNLLILRSAKNAQYDEIAANWNVSRTRIFASSQSVETSAKFRPELLVGSVLLLQRCRCG